MPTLRTLSDIFTQTPQVEKSRRQRRRLSTAGALLIRNTSTRRQAATSPVFALLRRGKQVQWSGSGMERLHKRMKWLAAA